MFLLPGRGLRGFPIHGSSNLYRSFCLGAGLPCKRRGRAGACVGDGRIHGRPAGNEEDSGEKRKDEGAPYGDEGRARIASTAARGIEAEDVGR